MSQDGYILTHRKLKKHWLWKNKPFSHAQAWLDLLFRANYQDNKVLFEGEIQTIPRGSFYAPEQELARDWGWSRSRVSRFKQVLKKDGMIEVKSNQKADQISICNYNQYQISRTDNEPMLNQSRTNHEPRERKIIKENEKSPASLSFLNESNVLSAALPKIDEYIEKLANDLYERKIFPKANAWVNKQKKEKKNLRAILHVLIKCLYKKDFKQEPWAYCQKIIEIEDGNFWEADYQRDT